tara:strand:- start:19988 stop:21097 length:1110 start_codon:yes stop_codon:yes gene_type:complete
MTFPSGYSSRTSTFDKRILSELRKQFDYNSYVDFHYSVKRTDGPEIRVCCIKCGEHKYKCYINTDTNRFHCKKCSFNSGKYDLFDFVAITEGMTRAQAMTKLVAEFTPVTPDDLPAHFSEAFDQDSPLPSSAIRRIAALPTYAFPLVSEVTDVSKPFWSYLLQRGLTVSDVLDAQMHYVPEYTAPLYVKNKYRGNIGRRVMWPVYGGRNHLVSWLARTISHAEPKYLNCPDAEQRKTLWPFVRPHHTHVILVEGILDAVAVRRMGSGTSCYATFGKKISGEQIKLLKSWGVDAVTLFWDKKDALPDMIYAVEELKQHFQVVSVASFKHWPINVDPGDCLSREDGVDIITQAVSDAIDVYSLDYVAWQIQ